MAVLAENPRGVPTQSVFSGAGDAKVAKEPKFVNLQFIGKDRYGLVKSNTATVILDNPGYEINELEGVQRAAARIGYIYILFNFEFYVTQ